MLRPNPTSLLASLVLCSAGLNGALAQEDYEYEKAPIRYSATEAHDATEVLLDRISKGELSFAGTDQQVLKQLLDAFGVPVESQVLVYSKTSLQIDNIRPKNPRAIFFSDHIYVGWVPGGIMELTAYSKGLGPTFYKVYPDALRQATKLAAAKNVLASTAPPPRTAEMPPPEPDKPPRPFERDEDCLRCHGGIFTDRVPGSFVRSVATGEDGTPRLHLGSRVVDHTTPLEERWGGWYVSGGNSPLKHRGNVFTPAENRAANEAETSSDLSTFFDTSRYLVPTSDILALMVLEHQTSVANTLTKAHYQTRQRMAQQQAFQRDLGETVTDEPNDTTRRVIEASAREVIDALLYKNEVPLPDGGISGSDAFRDAFKKGGRVAKDGRGLRDFQLLNRMFKYRCSFMIQSPLFDDLPPVLKKEIFSRLRAILGGKDPEGRYAYLSGSERKAIAAIVSDTVPGYALP